jgi:hypothetical protein
VGKGREGTTGLAVEGERGGCRASVHTGEGNGGKGNTPSSMQAFLVHCED